MNEGLSTTNIHSLAVTSDDQIFAGTFGGGVFRSSNNGDSWTQINTGISGFSVRKVGVTPQGHIYAVTQDGIFRSIDNGNSWIHVNDEVKSFYVGLAFNQEGHIFAGGEQGVFRSTDNGDTWVLINSGLTTTNTRALAVNTNGHVFVGTYGGGVFRSTDNGDNWIQKNDGLTSLEVKALAVNEKGYIHVTTLSTGVSRSQTTEIVGKDSLLV